MSQSAHSGQPQGGANQSSQPAAANAAVSADAAAAVVQAGAGAAPALQLSAAEIAATVPHGEPFLFIDEACIQGREIRGSYTITGREDFLRGHFKGRPVFPASIMLEALGQLAVLYLLKASGPQATSPDPDLPRAVDPEKIFFTSCDGVRCQRVCTPGDRLEMVIRPKRLRHPASAFEGVISVGSEKAVFAEKISLVFDYRSES